MRGEERRGEERRGEERGVNWREEWIGVEWSEVRRVKWSKEKSGVKRRMECT